MAYKQIKTKISASLIESQISKKWEKNNVFQKVVKKGKSRFIFFEGPPTANGKPGIHHIIARTIKDSICRYKSMDGYIVERKAGWDTHGLPVEIEVQKELNLSDRKKVLEYGIKPFNKMCRKSVFHYEKLWRKMTKQMGYWIDMDSPYITLENSYIESVWWILNQFFERGYIYKGHRIVPYCPKCGTPLSSHEVALGYREVLDPSVFVKFKKKDEENTYFLAWTTTPWTLISNAALAVNPKEKYLKIAYKNEKIIVAKSLVNAVDKDIKILDEFLGASLEFSEYEQLFDFIKPSKKAFFVVLADYVSMEEGSGIVHTAPAFGADDYEISKKYNLPLINPVDSEGKFDETVISYHKRFVKDCDKDIIYQLKKRGLLFKKEQIKHTYPFCWRCPSPLIYCATDSWYINTTLFKKQLIEQNNKINWFPKFIGEGRFGSWLENNVDWAISRDRFWGTPLNIWICKDCSKMKSIGSIDSLRKHGKLKSGKSIPEDIDLHKPYVDNIILKCESCSGDMVRTSEVIDCWFDSGAMPFAQWHYPFENSEKFEKELFPADFICEGIDQTRGWFYSLLAISVLLKGETPYKNVLVNDLILDKNGHKMSKSRGNTIDPFVMMDKYGADAVRWYLLHVSPPWVPTRFDEAGIKEIINKFFGTLKNVYSFFSTYSNIDKIKIEENSPIPVRTNLDRWIFSKLNHLIKKVKTHYDKYNLTKATREIQNFVIEDLSNWYVRRSRRRFWVMTLTQDKKDAFITLFKTLTTVCKLMAPIAPFLSDRIFINLTGKTSVHLESFPKYEKKLIDEQLEEKMDYIVKIVSLGRAARNSSKIKVRQTLSEICVKDSYKPLIKNMENLIKEEINVKKIGYVKKKFFEFSAKPNFKTLGPKYGKSVGKISKYLKNNDLSQMVETHQKRKIFIIELEGYNYEISDEDVILSLKEKENFQLEGDKNVQIALNTELTDELINEGYARELVNKIQYSRKVEDLLIMDNINIICKCSQSLKSAIKSYSEYIKSETLTKSITFTERIEDMKLWDINGEKLYLKIKRVEKTMFDTFSED